MFGALVGKTNKNQMDPQDTIKKVLKHRYLRCSRIIHLDLICMGYGQRKGGSQIENLIPDHKSLESRGQMKSNWARYTPLEKDF
jgi:hypothetical protein